MNEPNPTEILNDPLSSISRAERRNTLISSVCAILMIDAGILPTKISALGIELALAEQGVIVFTTLVNRPGF